MLDADPAEFVRTVVRRTNQGYLDLLDAIPAIEASERWVDDGARSVGHWLAMTAGMSEWRANRFVNAAYALRGLPRIRRALADGELSIDKALDLCRFATPASERSLVEWAARVGAGIVRRRADVEVRMLREDALELERRRSVHWWYEEDGRRFGLEASLPAAEGAIVAKALDRLASQIPVMPDEQGEAFADARRADALVALASAAAAADPDPDRATIVVHTAEGGASQIEDGIPVHRTTVERLLCTSRIQTLVESAGGEVVAISETARLAPAWMLRQVRYRDHGCRFPGCGARRFTEAHHIRFWRDGGRTSLENLVLICSFHHRLVHEHGWRLEGSGGDVTWRRPDGSTLRAGPPARAPVELTA